VEASVENDPTGAGGGHPRLSLRLLGPIAISRGGVPVPLPRSRKVRALLAFLTLEHGAQSRTRLCDLLWDGPNDPRGELRWCLSKLRALLDDPDHRRVLATGDQIELDLSDCAVDARELARCTPAELEQASPERLSELGGRLGGELLEGVELDGIPQFAGWLTAQRQRYRAAQLALCSALVRRARPGSDELFRSLAEWLRLAPFDRRAHELLLDALVSCGRSRDAEHHASATFRAFEQEGLDWSALREAWRELRARPLTPAPPPIEITKSAAGAPSSIESRGRRRASVAVMPFSDRTRAEPGARGAIEDGLTEDIITRLAKLRVLFVIARGSVYALGARGIGTREAGQLLNVEYVVTGSVRRHGARIAIQVELAETEAERVVWADELEGPFDETFAVLDTIVDRIVAGIAGEIESAECARAILRAPSSLDAWEAYHRGLWHMYKFDGPDNVHAQQYFRRALELDPTFSRPYVGLSFTHFQNAFLDLTPDREQQIALALETAQQSLTADDRDPGSHWALGRALWLSRKDSDAVAELERSIELSPNFALGYYTLGFVQSQAGDARAAIAATDYSRRLSPFDPLQFGMLASRAVAHLRLGELNEAADWAVKATARPNAHAHILAIAAQCLALIHRHDQAREFLARIRRKLPGYCIEDFLRAFHFDRDTAALLRRSARDIGFEP
jgi:DNA-binding SARP family transcriptional activator/Tfp pilus assembly protein PilF